MYNIAITCPALNYNTLIIEPLEQGFFDAKAEATENAYLINFINGTRASTSHC